MREHGGRGKSCGEILRRSGVQVCKPPPHPAGAVVSWSAGQPVPLERMRGRWEGLGDGENLLQMPNCCHNKQLGQRLPPFLVVNATTAHAAIVQHDERRREPGPLPVLWPSAPVVVAVLRWSAAGPLAVPGLAWSAVAVVPDLRQSAGTDRRG